MKLNLGWKTFVMLFTSSFLTHSFGQICTEFIVPKSAILQSETYTATISVNHVPSIAKIEILLNGSPLKIVNNQGVYTSIGSSPGEYTAVVRITVRTTDSVLFETERELVYIVFPPIASIQNERQFFFHGIDNPITVAVAGIPPSRVQVSADCGKLISTGAGKFVFSDSGNSILKNTVKISVAAKIGDDRIVSMGAKTYSIQDVHCPELYLDWKMDSTGKKFLGPQIMYRTTGTFWYYEIALKSMEIQLFHDGQWTEFICANGFLSDGAMQAVRKLVPGDKFIIERAKFTLLKSPNRVICTSSFAYTWE